MSIIKCGGCGISTVHPPKEFFSRKNGNGSWLLMCFNTDFIYGAGEKIKTGKKNQCLLCPPHERIFHGPAPHMETGFENDWIYFSDGESEGLIKELGLPINESFSAGKTNGLTTYISSVLEEEKMPMCFSERYISSVICNMLISTARNYRLSEFEGYVSYSSVRNARKNMLENYGRSFNLKKLANDAGYSVSRFCELYKSFYGTAPISDLINMRIKKARCYLLSTDKSVNDIARLCGFDSIHYFSALFKKQTGVSPLKYRSKR